jgi:hypothetical protein
MNREQEDRYMRKRALVKIMGIGKERRGEKKIALCPRGFISIVARSCSTAPERTASGGLDPAE